VPHIQPWSHLLYILSGTGDITIDGSTSPIRSGIVCQVRAGEKHSLRNLGEGLRLLRRFLEAIPRLKSRTALTTGYHDKAHDLVGTQHDRQLARQCARSAI